MTVYTKYTPDTYVFVQYAAKDNILRTVNFDSLLNNNVVFDLLTIFGDFINLNYSLDWLYLITFTSMLLFFVKYAYLLKNMEIVPVIIIYVGSFFVDINQFRFNLSSIMLYYVVSRSNFKLNILGYIVGFSCHIMPFILYSVTYIRSNLSKSAFGIFPILIIIFGTGFFNYVSSSRLFSYFSGALGDYPKVLLLFFPLVVFFLQENNGHKMRYELVNYALTSFMIGLSLFVFNYELTARFFEIAFIAICVANGFSERKPLIDLMLLVTGLTILGSRLLNGISTQTDFAEQYIQSW